MKAKDERKELENMLNVAENAIDGSVPKPGDTPELDGLPAFDIDYDKLEKSCEKQAKRLIKSQTGLMVNDETVRENPYIKEKLSVDIISLAGMLYQVEVTKIMQKDLIEEVRHGAKHNRMYEVFSGLTKTIGDMNKQLLQTVEAIKSTYKDLRYDFQEMQEESKQLAEGGITLNAKGLIAIGTKDLIKQVKQLRHPTKEEDNITDITVE